MSNARNADRYAASPPPLSLSLSLYSLFRYYYDDFFGCCGRCSVSFTTVNRRVGENEEELL